MMKNLVRFILFFCISTPCYLYGQTINSVKEQRSKAEKEIAYLNKLITQTQHNQNSSYERIQLLSSKVKKNENYIRLIQTELSQLDKKISNNNYEIRTLEDKRASLLNLYKSLIYSSWKNEGKTDMLMYLLASKDFNQAYNRYKYVQQTNDYSKKQLIRIKSLNDSLSLKNKELAHLVASKNSVAANLKKQKGEYLSDQELEKSTVNDLKKKEKDLRKKLDLEIKNRNKLTQQLNQLIAAQAKKSGSKTGSYKMTPEEKLVSAEFSKNKGRLPWPVTQGVISEKFGINQHPVYKKVELINNGISIMTERNSSVRAVFNGFVTEVWFVPGMNNVVIIRHGNYLTVYSNLSEVAVKKGSKVTTKQIIGKVAYDKDKGSVLNFQVWENTNKLNPELWLVK